MPEVAIKAKLALQTLACRAITLATVDEVDAITRVRPLEQIADGCKAGWGGTVYQMSPCRRTMGVVGIYSGLLTPAQAQAHPRRTELMAQRETRRAARKHLGRNPADCWTDHAHLITDTKSAEADAASIRWIADLESDGSRLRNLAGRAAHLGDGPSRHDMAHAAFLQKAAHTLRGASIEDLLDDMEDDGPQHWAPGSHGVPFPEADRTSNYTKAPERTKVRSVESSDFAEASAQREDRIRKGPSSPPAAEASRNHLHEDVHLDPGVGLHGLELPLDLVLVVFPSSSGGSSRSNRG